MTSICGSDEELEGIFEELRGRLLSSDREVEDAYWHLFVAGLNQDSDIPSNLPSDHNGSILESLPENALAMASLARQQPWWQQILCRADNPSVFPPVDDGEDSRLRFSQRVVNNLELQVNLGNWEEFSLAGDLEGLSTAIGVTLKDRLIAGAKRIRSPDWSAEEKRAYLESKVEALRVVEGKDWDFISQCLRERHGFERSSKCCEDLWGTLRKDFRAIRGHESRNSASHASNWVSYWEMDEYGRSIQKLPRLFPLEWYKMMERILIVQEMRKGERRKTRRKPLQKPIGDEDECSYLDSFRDYWNQRPTQGEGLHMSDLGETPNLKYAGRKRPGGMIFEEDDEISPSIAPVVKQQVEEAVNSALQRLPCRKRSGATTEEEDSMATSSFLVKQLVEDAVKSALQPEACEKGTGVAIDEDDLITRLAPVFKKLIDDALDSALQPVSFALQVREQEDQEYQEQLRALEEKKRALKREEMQIKRQRLGRHQRLLRTSYKQQGLRGKNPVAEGVISALKGLNITGDQDQVNHVN